MTAGADVNARFTGPHTETPLHWAASSDDVEALDALLDAGADIEGDGAVIGGGTPIADAVAFGQWNGCTATAGPRRTHRALAGRRAGPDGPRAATRSPRSPPPRRTSTTRSGAPPTAANAKPPRSCSTAAPIPPGSDTTVSLPQARPGAAKRTSSPPGYESAQQAAPPRPDLPARPRVTPLGPLSVPFSAQVGSMRAESGPIVTLDRSQYYADLQAIRSTPDPAEPVAVKTASREMSVKLGAQAVEDLVAARPGGSPTGRPSRADRGSSSSRTSASTSRSSTARRSSGLVGRALSTVPSGIAPMIVLTKPGRSACSSASGRSWETLGRRPSRSSRSTASRRPALSAAGASGIQRARVREREDEPLAGDAEPARGAVEAEQDDPLGDRLQLRGDGRDRARGARIGRSARHVVAAARGDLDAEDGRDEHHGDERQGERPHRRLRSLHHQRGRQRQQRQQRRDEEGGAERAGRGALELILEVDAPGPRRWPPASPAAARS